MKKIISLMFAICMILSCFAFAYGASDEATKAADNLYNLGLFSGKGVDANGKPIYDLDKAPTRAEAITMLVKLLGKYEEAVEGTWETPFIDVPTWAEPFVGYAYENGLTSGTGATTFGSNDTTTAAQYLTFVLKALGYEVGTDFQWNKAWELSDKIGITNGEYNDKTNKSFLRGDVVVVSDNSLDAKVNGTDRTLLDSISGNIETKVIASGKAGDNITWTLDNLGVMTFSGTGKMYATPHWISLMPSDYNGVYVTKIVYEEGITEINKTFGYSDGTNPHLDIYTENHVIEVVLPTTLKKLGNSALSTLTIEKLEIPASVNDIGTGICNGCYLLEEIIVEEGNIYYKSIDGVLYDFGVKTLIQYPGGKMGDYIAPDTLRKILPFSLMTYSGKGSIIFPEGFQGETISLIGAEAKYVYIPSTVTNNSNYLEIESQSIEAISVSEKNPQFCSVDGVVFTKDMNELVAYPGGKAITSYAIPDGVKHIHFSTFRDTNLEEVIIPDTVQEIDLNAFYRNNHPGYITIVGAEGSVAHRYAETNNINFKSNGEVQTKVPCGENAWWEFDEETGCVTIYGAGEVDHAGYTAMRDRIKGVIISDGITSVKNAFDRCSQLEFVFLPSSCSKFDGGDYFAEVNDSVEFFYGGDQDHWERYFENNVQRNVPNYTVHFDSNENDIPGR